MSFTARTMEILRGADRRISSSRPESSNIRNEACRHALGAIAPVDSFYVGTFTAPQVLTVDYVFDRGVPYGGDVIPFGPDGLSAHVLRTARSYTWHDDDGRLILGGLSFGDRAAISRDAVVVPIIAADGSVTGIMSSLSYRSDAFDAEFVEAAEWLATALAVSNDHHAAMLDRLDLSAIYPDRPVEESAEQMIIIVRQKLTQIDHFLTLAEQRHPGDADLDEAMKLLHEVSNYLTPTDRPKLRPTSPYDLSRLTQREREIVETMLSAGPLTNRQLAQRFGISEYTVKGHIGKILAKLELDSRRDLLAGVTSPTSPPSEDRADDQRAG